MDTLEIKKIKLSALQNETHTQFHDNVSLLIDRLPGPVVDMFDIAPLVVLYIAALLKERAALDIVLKSKYSHEMSVSDNSRDDIYRGFAAAVKALLLHYDTEKIASARRVMDILKHYGNISRKSYDDETAAIKDLKREFDRADLTHDLVTLDATDWLDKLVAANDEFERLSIQRFDEAASITHVRMKTVRTETDKYYRGIVQHLGYMVMVGRTSDELAAFINELNVIITHYKTVLAQRTGRMNKESKDA